MSEAQPRPDLVRIYDAKAVAERARADDLDPGSAAAGSSGEASAAILLLKGERSTAAGDPSAAVSAEEAESLQRAFAALGLPADDMAVIFTRVPDGDHDPAASRRRLESAIEACDPAWVVALDRIAGDDASAILGEALRLGEPRSRQGRVWLAIEGFEKSLHDPGLKRRVWAQMKALADARQ